MKRHKKYRQDITNRFRT